MSAQSKRVHQWHLGPVIAKEKKAAKMTKKQVAYQWKQIIEKCRSSNTYSFTFYFKVNHIEQ